jgi:DNA polymerase-1
MKLPKQVNRKTGALSADEKTLTKLSQKHPSPIFDYILNIRKKEKIVGTYLTDMYSTDNRCRCSYLVGGDNAGEGGTETGRISSRVSIFGTGTNLQNIPPGVCREMFIADPGHVILEGDLSQAEVRIVAYEAEELGLIGIFETNGDVHKRNACWMYGVTEDKVTNDMRQAAKKQVHGFDYGMGAKGAAYHAGISEIDAQIVMNKYFTAYPNIRTWQRCIESELGKDRTLTNCFGAKRIFFGRWGNSLFREAYAYKPQSTVALLLNHVMLGFHLRYPNIPILLQSHDAFACEVPEAELTLWAERMKECFEVSLTIKRRTFKIPCEMKWGKNWGKMEKIK